MAFHLNRSTCCHRDETNARLPHNTRRVHRFNSLAYRPPGANGDGSWCRITQRGMAGTKALLLPLYTPPPPFRGKPHPTPSPHPCSLGKSALAHTHTGSRSFRVGVSGWLTSQGCRCVASLRTWRWLFGPGPFRRERCRAMMARARR